MTMSPELDFSGTKHLNNKSKVESISRAPSAGTVASRAERELATEPVPVRGEVDDFILLFMGWLQTKRRDTSFDFKKCYLLLAEIQCLLEFRFIAHSLFSAFIPCLQGIKCIHLLVLQDVCIIKL